jgi:hypothetical protein
LDTNTRRHHARHKTKDPRARGRIPARGCLCTGPSTSHDSSIPPSGHHRVVVSRARAPAVSRATTLRRSLSSRQRRDRDALEDDVSSIVMRVPDPHSSDDETNDARDREDDAMHCRACGHDHAPGTTCGVCGHHREKCDRHANGVAECATRRRGDPIIEVIDKFLCLGAFEHTCREEVLLACGIRTVMNVRECFVRGDSGSLVEVSSEGVGGG